ncbi:MAG: HNH endonuclease [Enterobacterales bacterium]
MNMPNKITIENIQAAYELAKQVYNKKLKLDYAVTILVTEEGFNDNSAKDYINDYKCIIEGNVFKRALSATGIDYYLLSIKKDGTKIEFDNAIKSVRKHITYYEAIRNTNVIKLRQVISKHNTIEQYENLIDYSLHTIAFEEQVKKSALLSEQCRNEILASSVKVEKKIAIIEIFNRNPHVVAAVLLRAKGHCEYCGKAAPFRRKKDMTPYLEVHHIIQLADGGEDTVKNAQALCPNCHREKHFGLNK